MRACVWSDMNRQCVFGKKGKEGTHSVDWRRSCMIAASTDKLCMCACEYLRLMCVCVCVCVCFMRQCCREVTMGNCQTLPCTTAEADKKKSGM